MANPKHVVWLREGVESWNDRMRQSSFYPDLSSENISEKLGGHAREDIREISVNLKGVNLSYGNFCNSTLKDTNLTQAHISGANFTNAKLLGTDFSGSQGAGTKFTDAKLHSAILSRAQFLRSDFSSARLVGADLKGTEFWECVFDGAHLYNADIVGATFMQSRPWTARLFVPSGEDMIDVASFRKEGVGGINDLLDACRELRRHYREDATLYFRGEGRFSWDLRPSVMRISDDGKYVFRSAETEMLNDLMTRQPDAFNEIGSAVAQWVFAQHHGLKTRLLDITRNPLVALFNACIDNPEEDAKLHVFGVPRSLIKPFNSDTVRIISNFAKLPRDEQNLLLGKTEADTEGDVFPASANNFFAGRELFFRAKARLYATIRQESPNFEEKIDWRDFFRIIVVEPQRMFERLKAQSGAFLLSAFHEQFERDEVLKWNSAVPIYAHHILRVPGKRKAAILDELRLLNVTREVLYPSVDEDARAITQLRLNRASKY